MRGYLYTLEVFIAAITIITFLLVISFQQQDLSTAPEDLDETAYNLLRSLDNRELLRENAVNSNYNAINNNVILYRYNHSIQICDYENTCVGSTPNASNVWVGTYVISGYKAYSPHTVRLFIW
ncbi:MAG: hypothetical protein ABIF08_02300 [Nanoarchaeota archaeon]